jgi:geranylgeranyl diphosphate synthase type II
LLHCATQVHDDLPCFDNAPIRRGKPSVHAAFGERLAVLCGEVLMLLAMQSLADSIVGKPARAAQLFSIIGCGLPAGIVAGRAREPGPRSQLHNFQRAKTGAMFAVATMAGAAATGSAPEPWREMGERLGEAWRVAHDPQQDAAGASDKMKHQVTMAVDAMPKCPQAAELRLLIILEARRFLPISCARRVA